MVADGKLQPASRCPLPGRSALGEAERVAALATQRNSNAWPKRLFCACGPHKGAQVQPGFAEWGVVIGAKRGG